MVTLPLPARRRGVAVMLAAALSCPATLTILTVSGDALAQPAPGTKPAPAPPPAAAAATAKGRVMVKEKTGKPVRVVIDGIDVGEAPYNGEVDPGSHEVLVRGSGVGAPAQQVTVEAGKTIAIELTAGSITAPVNIRTADGKGLIFIDGKLVGEGSYNAELPEGVHKLKVTREGYDSTEEDITLKAGELFNRPITLKLGSKIETGPMQDVERVEGLYGGFNFLMLFTPGGTGNDIEKRLCDDKASTPTLVTCDAPDGFGAGLGGFVGYHWDPIGIEMFLAAQYDARTMKTDWNAASTDPGIGPDPARTEEYSLRRLGIMALARVRLTLQTKKIRFGMATGVGFTRRIMFLERTTLAKDNSGQKDLFVSDPAGYWSPVVNFEPAIMYRLAKSTAVTAGIQVFFDAPNTIFAGNGGANPQSNKEGFHNLGGRGLATNALDLASNIQVYIGPFIGMMFGP